VSADACGRRHPLLEWLCAAPAIWSKSCESNERSGPIRGEVEADGSEALAQS